MLVGMTSTGASGSGSACTAAGRHHLTRQLRNWQAPQPKSSAV